MEALAMTEERAEPGAPELLVAAEGEVPAAGPEQAEPPTPPAAAGREPPAAAPDVEPPSIADGVEHSLDPRSIPLDRIVNGIATATTSFFLLIGLLLTLLLASLPGWVLGLLAGAWAALSLFLVWVSYRWPEVAHRHASYKLDGQGIEIRKGVWWRSAIHVPRSRVQHTDVSQGPLESSHGLGTLVIYTAGTEYAMVDLPGLDHARALRIRDHLLPREDSDAV
jgi:hypothetical protein